MNILFKQNSEKTSGNWWYWFYVLLAFIIALLSWEMIPGFPSYILFKCRFPITYLCSYEEKSFIEHLSESSFFRVLSSVFVYIILTSVFVTIPLYIYKCFEKERFLWYYKAIWLLAAIICARVFYLLYCEGDYDPWSFHFSIVIAILMLTQIPASMQYHKKKNNQIAVSVYTFITWYYIFVSMPYASLVFFNPYH
jgi:hypothetical protein